MLRATGVHDVQSVDGLVSLVGLAVPPFVVVGATAC